MENSNENQGQGRVDYENKTEDELRFITSGPKKRSLREWIGFSFGRDFSVGCLTIGVAALMVFIGVLSYGILKMAYHVSVWLAAPIAALVVLVLLVTVVGRVVNFIYDRWGDGKKNRF